MPWARVVLCVCRALQPHCKHCQAVNGRCPGPTRTAFSPAMRCPFIWAGLVGFQASSFSSSAGLRS